QARLSVDDTLHIVAALKAKFPTITGPHKDDICYATTNRQEAVKQIAPLVDALGDLAQALRVRGVRGADDDQRVGCPITRLVLRAEEIDWPAFEGITKLGLTAGASAPEVLVEEIIDAFAARYTVTVDTVQTVVEDMVFPLPRELRSEAAE
ncbi:MAG: 4-hydroxy-3-methylbut-2-enyl diphosphate reductase, partial [Methylobacterium sp.]